MVHEISFWTRQVLGRFGYRERSFAAHSLPVEAEQELLVSGQERVQSG
jgi:hypothetical protein